MKKIIIIVIAIVLIVSSSFFMLHYFSTIDVESETKIISDISKNTNSEKEKTTIKKQVTEKDYLFVYYIDESYNEYKYCMYTMKKDKIFNRYKMISYEGSTVPYCESVCRNDREGYKIYSYYGENAGKLRQIVLTKDEEYLKTITIDSDDYLYSFSSNESNDDYYVKAEYIFNE